MSATRSRKVLLWLLVAGLGLGCSSTGSTTGGAKWPWTKSKTASDEKKGSADVLGAPAAPKQAKAGVNKPALSQYADAQPSVTLRTPRIIDDRELNQASR